MTAARIELDRAQILAFRRSVGALDERLPVPAGLPTPGSLVAAARLEMARRHLHVSGPSTAASFAAWAGVTPRHAATTYAALAGSLVPVRTPLGDAWALAVDEGRLRAAADGPAAPVRLLPGGDAFTLLQGAERELLVPDPLLRSTLWTSRVWPGALLVDGEIAGTWRRSGATITVQPWTDLPRPAREAIDAEAASLPLPGHHGQVRTRWTAP